MVESLQVVYVYDTVQKWYTEINEEGTIATTNFTFILPRLEYLLPGIHQQWPN